MGGFGHQNNESHPHSYFLDSGKVFSHADTTAPCLNINLSQGGGGGGGGGVTTATCPIVYNHFTHDKTKCYARTTVLYNMCINLEAT